MSVVLTYKLLWDNTGLSGSRHMDFQTESPLGLHDLFARVYKDLDLKYPKFHKMSNLAKLAFLGVEILKIDKNLEHYNDDEIALVFSNSYSSLDTDVLHQEKLDSIDAQASPSIFVYTLPNILMGEIAIRNKWFGENLFVLKEAFELEEWKTSANSLIQLNKAKAVIGGWVELFEEEFELKLFMLEKNKT